MGEEEGGREREGGRQQLSVWMTSAAAAAPHPPAPLPSVCQLAFEVQVKTDAALDYIPIIAAADKRILFTARMSHCTDACARRPARRGRVCGQADSVRKTSLTFAKLPGKSVGAGKTREMRVQYRDWSISPALKCCSGRDASAGFLESLEPDTQHEMQRNPWNDAHTHAHTHTIFPAGI